MSQNGQRHFKNLAANAFSFPDERESTESGKRCYGCKKQTEMNEE